MLTIQPESIGETGVDYNVGALRFECEISIENKFSANTFFVVHLLMDGCLLNSIRSNFFRLLLEVIFGRIEKNTCHAHNTHCQQVEIRLRFFSSFLLRQIVFVIEK